MSAGCDRLFDDDFQRRFGDAVAVHQALQGQFLLIPARGGDDRSFDLHAVYSGGLIILSIA